MIAACPTCGARCRIERGSVPASGARVRCPRCESVFRVRSAGEPREAAEPAQAPRAPASVPAPTPAPDPARTAPADDASRERLVLLADAEVEAGKAMANTLADWGLQPILVHDGVEAILTIQRTLPRVVILDAALPKMFGFQICELMKRNESLRGIHVVLMGAIHDRARYRRPPNEIYGADAYVERPQMPEALRTVLRGFGIEFERAPAAPPSPAPEVLAAPPSPAPEIPVMPTPAAPDPFSNAVGELPRESALPPAPSPEIVEPRVAEPVAPPPVAPEPLQPAAAPPPAAEAEAEAEADGEVAAAERLARIIISDVVLYNPEKFDAAVRAGNVVQAMDADMQEGRAHFEQRVPAGLRASRDFLAEELLRVARSRGMK